MKLGRDFLQVLKSYGIYYEGRIEHHSLHLNSKISFIDKLQVSLVKM